MNGEPTMVRRRTFTPADPEPDDRPPVVDAHGDVWEWESHECGPYCRVDGCETALYGVARGGWWSPTVPTFDLLGWDEIWDGGPGGGERDLRISEIFPDELTELVGERERGPVVDLDQMGACEPPPLANGHEVDMFTAAYCAGCRHSTDDDEPCDEFVLTVQVHGAWSPMLTRVPTSPTHPLGVACTAYAERDQEGVCDEKDSDTGAAADPRPDA